MTDVFSKAKRSEVMARIRGRGNKATEMALVAMFRKSGIRGWRRHTSLVGRPDFTFSAARLVVFVDGCFWHGCRRHWRLPSGNREFWRAKLDANRARDRKVGRTLRQLGWRVVRIWEHDVSRRGEYWMRRISQLLSQ